MAPPRGVTSLNVTSTTAFDFVPRAEAAASISLAKSAWLILRKSNGSSRTTQKTNGHTIDPDIALLLNVHHPIKRSGSHSPDTKHGVMRYPPDTMLLSTSTLTLLPNKCALITSRS